MNKILPSSNNVTMLKLLSVKERQQIAMPNKQSSGELRVQKELTELSLPSNISIHFPEGNNKIMHFEVTIKPEEGLYRNGQFIFKINIPDTYPYDAPKVLCTTKVFHPNIDPEGKICLNILREDWKPVLSILTIIHGLHFLFLDPNPNDPLNKEAAQMMLDNPQQFKLKVQQSIECVYK